MNFTKLFILAITIICNNENAFTQIRNIPDRIGWVNDYGHILDSTQVVDLTGIIANYEAQSTREIVIVTVDSIEPFTDILDFASEVGNRWGIGKRKKDNGVIIAVCDPCRRMSIATGYGTEKKLGDEKCKEIIDNIITPEFKKGNYFEGLQKGLIAIIENWK